MHNAIQYILKFKSPDQAGFVGRGSFEIAYSTDQAIKWNTRCGALAAAKKRKSWFCGKAKFQVSEFFPKLSSI